MPAISDLLDPANPLAWLLVSVTIAVVGSNAAWLLMGRRGRDALTEFQAGAFAALIWLLTALFLLIPPLLAWQAGVLSPYYLGVTEPQWLVAASVGAPVAAVIIGLFLFGWLVYRRNATPGADESVRAGQHDTLARTLRAVRTPLDATLCQWHWAFYRSLMIGWLALPSPDGWPIPALAGVFESLQSQPFYWGSWLGMAWIALEWALNPFARASLRSAGTREASLRGIALAFATTALFILTRNFWLCLACHVVVETAIAALFPLRTEPAAS
jgi:hypothetical protein